MCFQLRAYDGVKEPYICIGIKGEIYDVSRGKSFYGPGGPYHAFAGHDASRAFASFSTDDEMFKVSFTWFFEDISISRTNSNGTYRYEK